MKHFTALAILALLLSSTTVSQERSPVDTTLIHRIKQEGMEHSRIMETLSWLTDVHGPRLTGSPQFRSAARWAMHRLSEMGLSDVHMEGTPHVVKGWTLNRYYAMVTAPVAFPIISFPKAWSPPTNGRIRGRVMVGDPVNDSVLSTYRGKLKGAFVLLGDLQNVEPHFKPEATRRTDESLLELANADLPAPRRPRRPREPDARALLDYRFQVMCLREGALALLTPSRGDGGNVFVMGASVPSHPDTAFSRRPRSYEPDAPQILPQVVIAAEHYNRMTRMLNLGMPVEMEMQLDVTFSRPDSAYNIVADLPGNDLRDEVVMVGAHLDSWHGGTGATDNGVGVATCLEALRILKTLGLAPRRTIRVAFWGGEEQGTWGSSSFVERHLGTRSGRDTNATITYMPEAGKFSVYFNMDNGTGRFRGVYMQGNEAARQVFREWLEPFGEYGASTLSLRNTGSTDHVAFDQIGLPAYQFIQDDIEYFPRSWHSTMDVYDRAIEQDLKQNAVMMASFAYLAASDPDRFPRKTPPGRVIGSQSGPAGTAGAGSGH